jgi:hypothetical protein
VLGECICDFDGEPVEFYSSKMLVGRKEHECCECRRVIPKGVRHEHARMKYEGDWSEYRTCELCISVRNNLIRCGHDIGTLWEVIRYHFEDSGTVGEGDCWLDPPTHPIKGG